jgi:intracellular multiplication protein IcmG
MVRLDKMEGNVATIESLKDSVQILERKVAALSPSGPVISKRLSSGMAEKSSLAPAAPSAPAAPTPAPTILGRNPAESAVQAEADAAVIPAPAAPAEEESGPAWVLKGAQPGRAMVSRPGESDMRTVEVGSVLAGIGQVTDISYQDGQWVVSGTRGRITQ